LAKKAKKRLKKSQSRPKIHSPGQKAIA